MLQPIPKVDDVIYTHPDVKSNFKQYLVRELTVLKVGRKYVYFQESSDAFKDEYRYNINTKIVEEYWGSGDWSCLSTCVSNDVTDLEVEVNKGYLKQKLTQGLSAEEINDLPNHILNTLAEYF